MPRSSSLLKKAVFVLILLVFSLGSCNTISKNFTSKKYRKAEEEIERLKKELAILREKESLRKEEDKQLKELNTSISNALADFKSDELTVESRDGKLYISMTDKLLFKSGSAIVEEKGRAALKKVAEVMTKNKGYQITVEGHTDNVPIKGGTYKDNWDLSVARAVSVTRIICADNKLDPKKVTAAGRGEHLPVAPNSTPQGRAKNRRTELIISPLQSPSLP